MTVRDVCLALLASSLVIGGASAQSLDAGVSLDASSSLPSEAGEARVAPAAPAYVPAPARSAAAEAVIDVTATLTVSQRMQRSAEAVDVVDTMASRRRSADLGELLSQQPGVLVRRAGGLGSNARLTLNGLSDDQIRVFYDELPLDFVGFGLGVANVPLNLIERIEIYRGVVPLRFASDALGGAINLASRQIQRGTHGAASLGIGSWGTYRGALNLRHRTKTGLYANASAFLDDARNDYPVRVTVADQTGASRERTLPRFHDRYRAGGASVDVGFLGKRWADKLLLNLFANKWYRELQNNVDMSQIYGAASNSELVPGATLRYEKRDLLPSFDVYAVAGYSHSMRHVDDASRDAYDWTGRVVRTRVTEKGELGGNLSRRRLEEDRSYARLMLQYRLGDQHTFRAVTSPASTYRKGKDLLFDTMRRADPLASPQRLFSLISGVEYQLNLLEDRLENVAFLKHYFYRGEATEDTQLFGTRPVNRRDSMPGWGDSARLRLVDWLWLKASYEYAARLPGGVEVFGNGALVAPNPELRPERSHNVNLSAQVDGTLAHVGAVRSQLMYFLRRAEDLIALTTNKEGDSSYKNFFAARVRGVEASAGWTSLGSYLSLDGNVSYVDFRNTSDRGAFADYKGERIPNRPWLLANGSARVQLSEAFLKGDTIALNLGARYVKKFFLSWESAGTRQSKSYVPDQLQYSTGLEYLFHALGNDFSASFDLLNLSDAVVYDFYGVQKPGRSYYGKVTATF
jgi:vitamin B12 transporter